MEVERGTDCPALSPAGDCAELAWCELAVSLRAAGSFCAVA